MTPQTPQQAMLEIARLGRHLKLAAKIVARLEGMRFPTADPSGQFLAQANEVIRSLRAKGLHIVSWRLERLETAAQAFAIRREPASGGLR